MFRNVAFIAEVRSDPGAIIAKGKSVLGSRVYFCSNFVYLDTIISVDFVNKKNAVERKKEKKNN